MSTKYGLAVGGALNLRERPSTAANRLTLIPNETTLAVADHNDDWCATTYGSLGCLLFVCNDFQFALLCFS